MLHFRTLVLGCVVGLTATLATGADKAEPKAGAITGNITAVDRNPDGSGTITVQLKAAGKKKAADAEAPAGAEKKFKFTKATTVRRVKTGSKQGPRPGEVSDLAVGMLVYITARGDLATAIDIEERMKN